MHAIARLVVAVLVVVVASPVSAQVPDLAPWDGIWFKTKVKQKGTEFHVNAPGTEQDKFAGTVYVQLHFDTGTPDRLGMDVWVRESEWEKRTLTALYLGGTNDDALLVSNQVPVTPDPVVAPLLHLGFALRLTGKIAGGTVDKGSLKTLGGYFVEIDDVPGSDLRAGGSTSLSGKTTTKVPTDLPAG
jgi:hypothetical protein